MDATATATVTSAARPDRAPGHRSALRPAAAAAAVAPVAPVALIARVALVFAAAACSAHDHRAEVAAAPVAVTVQPAHEESLPVLYRASGTVRGRSTIVLVSRVAGYVRAIHVRSGDAVTAGQLLVELEANDTRAGVGRQRAELAHAMDLRAEAASAVEAARAAAGLATASRDRVVKLTASGAVTRQALDEADAQARATQALDEADAQARATQAQLDAAEARLRGASSGIDIARAALAEGEATLDYARVVAPFAGRVVERRVDPGALASPAMPLLVLDDGARLRVEAAVEESRVAAIRVGDPATVEIGGQPGPTPGSVGEIVPSVDVASRAFLVKIDLPASVGAIQPGTFARVGFASGARPRLVVPTTAISALGALDRVFVVDGGVARLRMIGRGEAHGAWTEILSGLSAGEQVVAAPGPLRDGAAVEVRR